MQQNVMAARVKASQGRRPPQSLGDSVREDLAKNLKERNLQFRFKAVENIMAPLIHEVSCESNIGLLSVILMP